MAYLPSMSSHIVSHYVKACLGTKQNNMDLPSSLYSSRIFSILMFVHAYIHGLLTRRLEVSEFFLRTGASK